MALVVVENTDFKIIWLGKESHYILLELIWVERGLIYCKESLEEVPLPIRAHIGPWCC